MTHLDIYRCDRVRCQKEAPAEYWGQREGREGPYPPRGWLSVRPVDGHFCSLDCLAIWARAERAAMEAPA